MAGGKLYVVATPIGNLEDITLRALRVLGDVDFIAAENARYTGRLLSHHGINTPVVSYTRDMNKRQAAGIIRRLKTGESAALVSNAGTPGISDPGSYLVRLAVSEQITAEPVPGPSALCAAMSVSGMTGVDFAFLGYLSCKSGRRKKQLAEYSGFEGCLVVYEGPHRLLRLFGDVLEVLGDRYLVVCRELTKKFEEIIRCRASFARRHFSEKAPRGEFTVIISGGKDEEKLRREEKNIGSLPGSR